MSNFNLYQMAQYILGDLPSEYQFLYVVLTFIEALALLWCLFAPFIFAYNFFKR